MQSGVLTETALETAASETKLHQIEHGAFNAQSIISQTAMRRRIRLLLSMARAAGFVPEPAAGKLGFAFLLCLNYILINNNF